MEAVGAQEQLVALAQLQVGHLDADVGGHADRVDQHGAVRRDQRLLDRQLALDHQHLGHGVVGGELGGLAVADQVRAAVADVGDEGLAAGHQHNVERGAHAGLVGLLAAALVDRLVGGQHRALQQLHQRLAGVVGGTHHERVDQADRRVERLRDGLDRHRAGDLAGRVAAHAVGHDEEPARRIHVHRVLVVIANDPNVGEHHRLELHAWSLVMAAFRAPGRETSADFPWIPPGPQGQPARLPPPP